MLNQNDRIARFTEEINKTASNVCKKMNKQVSSFKKKELSEIKKEAKADLENRLKFEKDRNSSETNKTISLFEAESKMKIAAKRDEITVDVFSKAKEKLLQFTETAQYAVFLRKSIEQIRAEIGNGCVLYVRNEDKEAAEHIASEISEISEIRTSDKIKLGGAFAESANGAVMADDTLDTRLMSKKEWFMSVSGLSF